MLLVFRSNRSPEGDVATASRDGAAEPGSVHCAMRRILEHLAPAA